jgi:hypothetical protein
MGLSRFHKGVRPALRMSQNTISMLARCIAKVRRFLYSTSHGFSQNPKVFSFGFYWAK